MTESESTHNREHLCIERRSVLKLGVLASIAAFIPDSLEAAIRSITPEERSLSFLNLHSKESLEINYWKNGSYDEEALDAINYLFRDHRSGAVKPIDRKLLDLLYAVKTRIGSTEPFHLISGYRSRRSNNQLRHHNGGVAKNSLHVLGQAADIRLPGSSLKQLRSIAFELKGGGVGYYPRSNFVHLDVGQVRYWNQHSSR
ncbi:MAG: YcbK family protein [Nitrospiraceae bacterium]|nr:MAG: YcbK family protein [Nitrospiraceae bacterium]